MGIQHFKVQNESSSHDPIVRSYWMNLIDNRCSLYKTLSPDSRALHAAVSIRVIWRCLKIYGIIYGTFISIFESNANISNIYVYR